MVLKVVGAFPGVHIGQVTFLILILVSHKNPFWPFLLVSREIFFPEGMMGLVDSTSEALDVTMSFALDMTEKVDCRLILLFRVESCQK